MRVIKIVKDKSKLVKYAQQLLQLSLGAERMFFFIVMSGLITHIISCMWIFSCSLAEPDDDTWLKAGDYEKLPTETQYLISFYYAITTMTTVGYGDISAKNNYERVFAIVIMLLGQVAFTYAISILGQILSSYDNQNAKFQEKVVILNRLYKEYALPLQLYTRLKQSLRYKYNKDIEDLNEFVDELP